MVRGVIAIITGGRDKRDKAAAFARLDAIDAERGITVVIEGGQRTWCDKTREVIGGADYFALQWAMSRGKHHYTVAAEWREYGKRAGPIRNQAMLDRFKPDFVVNMTGGAGTADMIAKARRAGVEVIDAPIS